MMSYLIIVLEILFPLNLSIFWLIFFKFKERIILFRSYKKIFPIIWTLSLAGVLILGSNFLQFVFPNNFSYFQGLWPWFLVLGIIFVFIGTSIISKAIKLLKIKAINENTTRIVKSGPYSQVRHPVYLGWILIYMGLSFVLDSFLAIVYIPFLILFLNFHSIFEEKYVLIPNSGKKYEKYKKNNPYRLFFPPYNYVILLIGLIVAYIGVQNYLLTA